MGDPEDIADIVAFLCTDKARWVRDFSLHPTCAKDVAGEWFYWSAIPYFRVSQADERYSERQQRTLLQLKSTTN